jgi:Smg protein
MFDILLFLYDNYLVADLYPDPETLSRKLMAAGFEETEIDQALDWLSALESLRPVPETAAGGSLRCYSADEQRRLDPLGIGFLIHLEHAGLLPPHAREWVIEQAMALEEGDVSGDKIKWIALLAIARLYGPGDALWLEDLARGGEDGWRPTVH